MTDKNMDFDKSELIKKLDLLRELEVAKPTNEMDTDLIDEIILLGLELKDLDTTLSPEDVTKKVRKIPFVENKASATTKQSEKQSTKKVKPSKFLLIAAIIAIITSLFIVTSIASQIGALDELKNMFGEINNAPINEEINIDEFTFISYGKTETYSSIEEFLTKRNLNLLYPAKLPNNIKCEQLILSEFDSYNELIFSFNDTNFSYTVTFEKSVPDEIKAVATYTQKINDIEAYITELESVDVTQIYFEYKGDLYFLSHSNKQELVEIIKNLKEF